MINDGFIGFDSNDIFIVRKVVQERSHQEDSFDKNQLQKTSEDRTLLQYGKSNNITPSTEEFTLRYAT